MTEQLQRIDRQGWRVGFGNLLRKENGAWWGTRSWLIQAVIWLAIINGLVAMVLWMVPQAAGDNPDAPFTSPQQAVPEAVEIFFAMAGMASAVGIVIIMQDSIVDERQSGTLEWILSKPVARPAVILAKALANSAGALVIMVALQGAVAYAQFMLAGGDIDPLRFVTALGLLALHLLFYLVLTLLLGVVFKGRGGVIGLPLAFLFGYQIVAGILPDLAKFMPWGLLMPISEDIRGLAQMHVHGQPLTTLTPVYGTVVLIIGMLALAIWRFNKMEF